MKILRPEVLKCVKYNVPGKHGALDLIDDLFLMSFNITDDEFNFICANANSEEIEILVDAVSGAEDRIGLPFSASIFNILNALRLIHPLTYF